MVGVQLQTLLLGKRTGTHLTGVLVGLSAGIDGCRRFRPLPGSDSRTVQQVAIPSSLSQLTGDRSQNVKVNIQKKEASRKA